jgi:hypothetical protein
VKLHRQEVAVLGNHFSKIRAWWGKTPLKQIEIDRAYAAPQSVLPELSNTPITLDIVVATHKSARDCVCNASKLPASSHSLIRWTTT